MQNQNPVLSIRPYGINNELLDSMNISHELLMQAPKKMGSKPTASSLEKQLPSILTNKLSVSHRSDNIFSIKEIDYQDSVAEQVIDRSILEKMKDSGWTLVQ